jgi:hypothetical protein
MAPRKKARAAQRGKTAKSRGKRGRAIAVKRKATKRSSAKAVPQKRSAKAKTKRIVTKVAKPKAATPRKQRTELPIEVVKVKQVDEPAPGVVVVAEYESVQVGPTPLTAVPDEPT